ncbi:hypothetical protein D3C87_1716770 [compost metagenome]
MFGIDIVHDEGGMAVAVTCFVRFRAVLVDCQFQFERVFRIGQIDEGKSLEIEPLRDLQSKRAVIKINRPGFIEYPDHAVDEFRHAPPSLLSLMDYRDGKEGRVLFCYYLRIFARGYGCVRKSDLDSPYFSPLEGI